MKKVLIEVKIDQCFKTNNDEKFLSVRQIQCHMGIRTFNRLYVLNILVPICSAPQQRWPTDLNINRDHILIKDYLPPKFDAFRAKYSWVISCTKCGDQHYLWPTDLSINRDHLLIKEFLASKFEASGAKRYWVITCIVWETKTTFGILTWISIGIIKVYLPTKFEASGAVSTYQLHKVWETNMTFDLLT